MQQTQQKQLLKDYESKIIHLNTQLETLRAQKEELTSQHERVKGLLSHSNSELQLKSGLLQDKTNTNQKLRKQIEGLEGLLKGAQYHRKVLFDHMFTSQIPNISNEFQNSKNNLLTKISDLKNEFVGSNYVQFEEIINSRNDEIRTLTQKYNDLAKQHMKSVNEYQVKISQLKQDNLHLKRNDKNKTNIEQKLREFKNNRGEQFEIAHNNLEERLDLVLERLKISQGVIKELKQELGQYKRKERENKIHSQCQNGGNAPEIDEFLNAVSQNRLLRKEMDEINEKYEKLVIEFPNIVKNEDQILDFLQKHQKLSQLETEQKLKIIKIQELERTITKIKEQNIKLQKQVRQKIIQNDGTVQSYENILDKFKQFFTMVNPYYGTYAYSQLGLDNTQLQLLRKGKSPSKQTLLRTELNKLEQKNSNLQIELSSKTNQISKQMALLQSHTAQIQSLQSLNSKLLETINTNIIQQNHCADNKYMEYLLSSFTKIQEERDQLKIECKDREIKIMELMVEVAYLRANKSDQRQEGLRNEMEGEGEQEDERNVLDACQSSIVWINFNQDMSKFQSKLTELQTEIHQTNSIQNQSIQLIHSQYQSQILNLKQTIQKLQQNQQNVNKFTEIEHKNVHQEKRKQNNEPLPEHGSLADIDPMLQNQEGMEQPINSLSAENIQDLSKMLSGHQTNLKNVLSAYNSLKQKFVQLQQKYNKTTLETDVEKMTENLQRLVNELKAAEVRIAESDKNVLFLEDQIENKSLELEQIREQTNQEIDVLKVMVEGLKKENVELKQDNWLEKPQDLTQPILNKNFPEEIQYLIQLVLEKNRQISQIKSQNKKNDSQVHEEQQFEKIANKKSEEMKAKEFEELQRLVNDGELLNLLCMAVEKFKNK